MLWIFEGFWSAGEVEKGIYKGFLQNVKRAIKYGSLAYISVKFSLFFSFLLDIIY